jgi:hypothetical protein
MNTTNCAGTRDWVRLTAGMNITPGIPVQCQKNGPSFTQVTTAKIQYAATPVAAPTSVGYCR